MSAQVPADARRDTPRYAVFGRPVAHSLSPRIHAAFGAQLGIAMDYRAIEADCAALPAALAAFAAAGGRGANLTLPLKQAGLALCRQLAPRARRAGSVNTLIRQGDAWLGDSTDGAGLLRDLRERQACNPAGRRVLLLGAGGAARAAAFALLDAGVAELAVSNRTAAHAVSLVDALGTPAHAITLPALAGAGPFELVVNATSAGHAGAVLPLPASVFAAGALAYDLSYGRAAQPFLTAAQAAGAARAVDGLGMLVEQAAESFALWQGVRPDTAALYASVQAERAQADLPEHADPR